MVSTFYSDKKYSDVERWLIIYPAYINSKKTSVEGRRISKDKCVENPTCHEMKDVLDAAGFHVGIENKLYPREQNRDNNIYRGRVRVQLRNEDGTLLKPTFENKKSILLYLGETIPKLKTRQQGKSGGEQSQNISNAAKKNKGKKGRR